MFKQRNQKGGRSEEIKTLEGYGKTEVGRGTTGGL